MEIKIKKKRKIFKELLILFLIFISTLFMSVGYASVNSISMNIEENAEANEQDGIFITDYNLVSDESDDGESSEVTNITGTLFNSNINLSSENSSSEITYKVKFYNNYDCQYLFNGTSFDEKFYSNNNITYEITSGTIGDKIASGDYLELDITFKYKEGVTPTSEINNLISYINFDFIPHTVMVNYDANGGTGGPSTQTKYVGKNLVLTSEEPTREGYNFLGWNIVEGETEALYLPGAEYTFDEEILLYAVWEYIPYYIYEDFEDNDINSALTLNSQITTINSTNYSWSVSNGQYRTNDASNGSTILSGLTKFSIISTIEFTPLRDSVLTFNYGVSSSAWTSVDYSIILTGSDGSSVTIINESNGNSTSDTTPSALLKGGVSYKLTLTHAYPKWYSSTYAYIDNIKIEEYGTYVVSEDFEDTEIDPNLTLSTETTTINSTQYIWSVSDGRYRTNNASNGSSSSSKLTIKGAISFTPTADSTLSFTYGVSSTAWSLVDYSIVLNGSDGSSVTLVNQSSESSSDEQTTSTTLKENVTYTLNLTHSYPEWYSNTYAYIDNIVIH